MTNLPVVHSLADLAVRIRSEHEAVFDSARQTLQHALNAGELLIEAKSLVDHGNWSDWLHDNCAVSQRTAQSYMRLARNRTTIEANTPTTALLTIDDALSGLAKSKPSIDIEADEIERAIVRNVTDYLPDEGQAVVGILSEYQAQEMFGIIESEKHPGYYHLAHIEFFLDENAGGIASEFSKPVRADSIRLLLEHLTRFPNLLDRVEWSDCQSRDWPFPFRQR